MQYCSEKAVLVVEDDPGAAELIVEKLTEIGCICRKAENGKDALLEIDREKPALVVLDYSLPDMDGHDIISMEGFPPFLIITGQGDEYTAVSLMRAGALDYVIKDHVFLDNIGLVVERALTEIATKEELREARQKLEQRLREREVMLREIHHRVKNNLQIISSLLRLQDYHTSSKSIEEIIDDMESRINAMASIHEMLYESQNLSRIDFSEYLKTLVDTIVSSAKTYENNIDVIFDGASFDIEIDKAVPLGLLANELINNAIKHAFAKPWNGQPKITIRTGYVSEEAKFIEICDNGKGMEQIKKDSGGLGLVLVNALAKQLNAKAVIKAPGPEAVGTRWYLEIDC